MSDICCISSPKKIEGLRKLTPLENSNRLAALRCIHDKESTQCQGQVYVSLFFDGTGNNKEACDKELAGRSQEESNKHSNVARLFNASLAKREDGFFPFYIPGIGTKFKEVGDNGGSLGMGFGYMGAHRINWGITRIFNAVSRYSGSDELLPDDEAKKFVKAVSRSEAPYGKDQSSRSEAQVRYDKFKALEVDLKKACDGQQRKVTQINIAVFGFSRGAAAARAFANWLFEIATQDKGGYTLAGIPVRLYFMGLFDTVAAVGTTDSLPGMNGHAGWADKNMHINPGVEQCVHFIALHEQRAGFPLELADNVQQVAYPGMHSDVGGGYRPGEQGKAMPDWGQSPHLSQIPLVDMHYAALMAGVPLLSGDEIKSNPRLTALAKDFDCSPQLIEAVKSFYRDCKINSEAGSTQSVMQVLKAHTLQYLRWRATLSVKNIEQYRFYRDAIGIEKRQLFEGVEDFSENWRDLRWHVESSVLKEADAAEVGVPSELERVQSVSQRYRELNQSFKREQMRRRGETKSWVSQNEFPSSLPDDAQEIIIALETNAEPLPDSVRNLFEDYVHDSRAGFRPIFDSCMEIGGGYFRYRRVFKNGWQVEMAKESDVGVEMPPLQRAIGSQNAVQ